jgi:hypothetical protein
MYDGVEVYIRIFLAIDGSLTFTPQLLNPPGKEPLMLAR